MRFLLAFILLVPASLLARVFSCPDGKVDVLKYFVLSQDYRSLQYMNGTPNPLYTQVFPDEDFAKRGYWFWLKSATAHGFDVKAFDDKNVYMRSTELIWNDNTTFKRFVHDLPIAVRCVEEGKAGPEIKVEDTFYRYYSACKAYHESRLGTAIMDLDAPALMETGGDIGQVWTRILHYHYNCDKDHQSCTDEEQFFLANGYGEWQWKHYQNGTLLSSTLINNLEPGTTDATLPCPNSYTP